MFGIVVLLAASILLEPASLSLSRQVKAGQGGHKLVTGSVSLSPIDMHARTKLSVKPETLIGPPPAPGDTFIDSIYVEGADYLWGWQLYWTFNPIVLNAIE
ncbi:MAG: hypothetical protein QMD71_02460, partial [bacterium]|nr:hypothetical protein [bacterium]